MAASKNIFMGGGSLQQAQNQSLFNLFNTGLFDFGFGFGGGGGGTPAPQPAPAPAPAPAVPTAGVSPIQLLVSSVPTAAPGGVITSEHHNSLRTALLAMANQLGLGPLAAEGAVTFAPRLLPKDPIDTTNEKWDLDYGIAKKTTGTAGHSARGWMELDLPDGTRIQKMAVYGQRGATGTMTVALVRQPVTDPAGAVSLITVPVTNTADPQQGVSANVSTSLPGASNPAGLEEYRTVDNTKYKYVLTAELTMTAADSTGFINAVQVVCRLG